MGRRNPVISTEFASTYGLTIESLKEYCERAFIVKSAALNRINRNQAYGYKVNKRWFVVTKNGEDLKDIIV